MGGWASLLKSRKVLLAALGVTASIVGHYLEVPADVWLSIDALLVAVILGISHEDAAEKSRGRDAD